MDTARARKAMVDSQVRPNDVPDFRLQKAMETIPREAFVPANRRALAYVEKEVPLFDGRWLLQARDFSKLIHAARIRESDLVLDVACGLGYSTAVLSRMAGVVVGLEDDEEAMSKAEELLLSMGYDNAAIVVGKLSEGVAKQGPYDVIVIAHGIEQRLDTLLQQLKPEGGRLVTIEMKDNVGHAILYTRNGDAIGHRYLFECYPPEVLKGFESDKAFTF